MDLEEGERRSGSPVWLSRAAEADRDRVDGGGGGPHRHRRKPSEAEQVIIACVAEIK